jgi:hypothetical protein
MKIKRGTTKKKSTTKKRRSRGGSARVPGYHGRSSGIFSTVKFESSSYEAKIRKFYMNGKVMSDRSSWITISKNLIYISRSEQGRQYWVLSKSRPSIRFDNEKMTLTIANNYKVKFSSLKTLNKVKSILQ